MEPVGIFDRLHCIIFTIAALGTYSLFVERNALQRAAVNVVVGIGRGKLGLEHFALHHVLREAVLNALLLVYVRNGGQQRVVFAQNQRVIEIFQLVPSRFLNLVTRECHVYPFVDRVLDLDGQDSRGPRRYWASPLKP